MGEAAVNGRGLRPPAASRRCDAARAA